MTMSPTPVHRPADTPATTPGAWRPVFIGGCPRSGTTLLGALLGAHSRCVCVPEMPFKLHPMLRADWGDGGLRGDAVGRLVRGHPNFLKWEIPAVADPERRYTYREAIESFVSRYASAVLQEGGSVWADHTPSNIMAAKVLLDAFPDAIMLHVVRDGRGVAASLLPLRWSVSSMPEAAQVWAEHLGYGLAAELAHPARVHRVQYEELVRDPVRVMARICEIVGLPHEPQIGRETRFRIPASVREQHRLVASPPVASRAEGWRHSLRPRQIEIFESVAGSLLHDLGYELLFGGRAQPLTRRERTGMLLSSATGKFQRLTWRVASHLGALIGVPLA